MAVFSAPQCLILLWIAGIPVRQGLKDVLSKEQFGNL